MSRTPAYRIRLKTRTCRQRDVLTHDVECGTKMGDATERRFGLSHPSTLTVGRVG